MAKKGQKYNKYSYEFKIEAVEKYLSGELGGMTFATRKLGLKNHGQLRNWIKLYKQDPELLNQDNRGRASIKDGVKKGRPKQIKLNEFSKCPLVGLLINLILASPFKAHFSILGPPGYPNPKTLATLSNASPIASSWVVAINSLLT